MGVLLLKKWRKSAIFFVHFCVRRVFWCFFCRGVCGWGVAGAGGGLLWLVVLFLCDVVGAGGFSGNRVSSCSWWWALGSLSVVVWA